MDPAYYYCGATVLAFIPIFIAGYLAAVNEKKGAGMLRAAVIQTTILLFFVQLAVYVSVVGWKMFFGAFFLIAVITVLSVFVGVLFSHARVGREIDESR
jgi:hypothetical protein